MKQQRFHILAPNAIETWDWRSPDDPGIGGSETAVTEVSRRLGLRGHDVTVWAPIKEDTVDDGPTKWRNMHDLGKTEICEPGIWYVCRCPQVLDAIPGNKWQRIWHRCDDVHYHDQVTPARAAKVERWIVMSETHRNFFLTVYPFLDPNRVVVIGGGITSARIKAMPPVERDPNRLIWTSSPDRGLEFAIPIFQMIREYWPDLELHIHYGWDNPDKGIAQNPNHPLKAFKAHVLSLNQENVFWDGRVTKDELFRSYQKSAIWFYPTNFQETFPVHGDTLIETLQGRVKIRDLVGRSAFPVYSCNTNGDLSISTVNWVGRTRVNTPVVKLRAKPGRGRNSNKVKELILTPDHEVMMLDGTYCPASELVPGDRIKAFHRVPAGWGDGYATIGVTGRKLVPEHQFVATRSFGRPLASGEVVDHLDGDKTNNLPGNLVIRPSQSDHAKDHWTRLSPEENQVARAKQSEGWAEFWASPESVDLRERRSQNAKVRWESMPEDERRRWTADRESKITPEGRLRRAAAAQARVDAKYGNSPWRNRDTLQRLYTDERKSTVEIGKILGCSSTIVALWLKKRGIAIRSLSESQRVRQPASNHTVISVEDAGTADVYCMEVDPDHNFVANGIFVHNCVSSCEAQAFGALPVCPPTWGLGHNVHFGITVKGQVSNPLTQARYVAAVLRLLYDPELCDQQREKAIPWALDVHNWERRVDDHERMACQ